MLQILFSGEKLQNPDILHQKVYAKKSRCSLSCTFSKWSPFLFIYSKYLFLKVPPYSWLLPFFLIKKWQKAKLCDSEVGL